MPFSHFADELEQRRQQGLLRRRRLVESPQGVYLDADGRPFLSFCSNDYLGLANHPALVEAASQGAGRYGVGAGASHLVSGHFAPHHRLEEELAAFVGLPRTLLFSGGYMANVGVVTALVGRGDTVFADKLNHASLNDAMVLSRAHVRRYPHLDLAALEKALAETTSGRKLVVSDAVFSMDGDVAPVNELLALCERHDAWLLLDDAHGFGVLGKEGRGSLSHFDVRSPRIVYMATLGKAAGVFGAFVAGGAELVEGLIQNARSYIYTTAMPPLLACALSASLKLIAGEDWRRQRLRDLVARLRTWRPRRWQLMDSETPIQPLLVGGNEETLAVSEGLLERGILVPAIRPPTVPKGGARLRISLSAAHSPEDVDRLLDALKELE
ncbi:MAG: 8-amino-7-oxononanoate synthase [Sulfuricellaceae bacterium]|jgi:8-amino-7-oxononanoate synthase